MKLSPTLFEGRCRSQASLKAEEPLAENGPRMIKHVQECQQQPPGLPSAHDPPRLGLPSAHDPPRLGLPSPYYNREFNQH
ncbi:hypothetical protein SDJN02_00632, partial [Cucurbita argyrosperma subsp. argyrosperma]